MFFRLLYLIIDSLQLNLQLLHFILALLGIPELFGGGDLLLLDLQLGFPFFNGLRGPL